MLASHHPTTKSLFSSASAGCPLCTTICSSFYEFLDQEKSVPCHPERHTHKARLRYKLGRVDEIGPSGKFIYQFYCQTSEHADDTNHGHIGNLAVKPIADLYLNSNRKVSTRTDSEESWTLATTWLSTCLSSHPICNASRTQDWLPTRVLDLGTAKRPRLCLQTSTSSLSSSYMTLSHCWGKLGIKQLTTLNIHSLRNRIVISELPRTFQDAIAFTRRCGVRYLWIDSLCIIQDSANDWSFEAARMGDVYKHALCNLAATAALDGQHGCFFQRNYLLVQPMRVRIPSFSLNPSPTGVYEIAEESFWYRQVSTAPLNTRAWVLQEQLLSNRVIHCGEHQLLWECRELAACEMHPQGFSRDDNHDAVLKVKSSVLLQKLHSTSRESEALKGAMHTQPSYSDRPKFEFLESRAGAIDLWRQLISRYTERSLTKIQDRLIAISAVVKEFQPLIQATYLAGMWQCELETGLLWCLLKFANKCASPDVFVAPSWSWASVTATVLLFDPEVNRLTTNSFMIQILECEIIPTTKDRTGQISGGCIKLRGWLRSLRGLKLAEGSDNLRAISRGDSYLNYKCFAYARLDEDRQYREEDVFALPIVEADPKWGTGIVVVGLLLEKTGNGNQYRRIGHLASRNHDGRAMFHRPEYPPSNIRGVDVGWSTADMEEFDRGDRQPSQSASSLDIGVTGVPECLDYPEAPTFPAKSHVDNSSDLENYDSGDGQHDETSSKYKKKKQRQASRRSLNHPSEITTGNPGADAYESAIYAPGSDLPIYDDLTSSDDSLPSSVSYGSGHYSFDAEYMKYVRERHGEAARADSPVPSTNPVPDSSFSPPSPDLPFCGYPSMSDDSLGQSSSDSGGYASDDFYTDESGEYVRKSRSERRKGRKKSVGFETSSATAQDDSIPGTYASAHQPLASANSICSAASLSESLSDMSSNGSEEYGYDSDQRTFGRKKKKKPLEALEEWVERVIEII